jgi:hypothetical protein
VASHRNGVWFGSGLAFIRAHTFDVGKHDIAVQHVVVVVAGVRNDGIRDDLLVVAPEIGATPWALVLVDHGHDGTRVVAELRTTRWRCQARARTESATRSRRDVNAR